MIKIKITGKEYFAFMSIIANINQATKVEGTEMFFIKQALSSLFRTLAKKILSAGAEAIKYKKSVTLQLTYEQFRAIDFMKDTPFHSLDIYYAVLLQHVWEAGRKQIDQELRLQMYGIQN